MLGTSSRMSRLSLLSPSRMTSLTSTAARPASFLQLRAASGTAHPASLSEMVAEDQVNGNGEKVDQALRLKAIKLYKELHRLGRDYPDPEYHFNQRLRRAFEKNAKTTDPKVLQEKLAHAEHIKKEILAMISLKKYRYLRRTYHPNEGPR